MLEEIMMDPIEAAASAYMHSTCWLEEWKEFGYDKPARSVVAAYLKAVPCDCHHKGTGHPHDPSCQLLSAAKLWVDLEVTR